MTEVLASQRYNAHMVPEDGTLTCSDAGVCKSAPAGHQPRNQEPPAPWLRGAVTHGQTDTHMVTWSRLQPFVSTCCMQSQRRGQDTEDTGQGQRDTDSEDTGHRPGIKRQMQLSPRGN
jgi:hypothetical protein